MNIPAINISSILPSVVLAVVGILIMVIDPFLDRAQQRITASIALGGVALAGLAVVPMANLTGTYYSKLWVLDDFTIFFHAVFLFIAGLTIPSSMDFIS